MNGKITFRDFGKLDLRVGRIIEVVDHPNADKLYVMTVDLGKSELRTIIAGLKGYYAREELKGTQAIFVVNLEPVMLRGIESNGMILAVVSENKEDVVIVVPEKEVCIGGRVH